MANSARDRPGFIKPGSGAAIYIPPRLDIGAWSFRALAPRPRGPEAGLPSGDQCGAPGAPRLSDSPASGALGRPGALSGPGFPAAGAGPAAERRPRHTPPSPPPDFAEARKGPVLLPSPSGMHGGRSRSPRTRREPSSGEEAAPVTAMAAESALQVVEKLQARLATNADPKKVSELAAERVRRGAGVGRGAAR